MNTTAVRPSLPADQARDPRTHTCAVRPTCTRRATGVARVPHAIVWACERETGWQSLAESDGR